MCLNTKQLLLPVVLFLKKGVYKYSQHVYSLSVTLQQSVVWIGSPDHTVVR